MPETDFASFLSHSLDIQAREATNAYRSLGRTLAPHSVRFEVGARPVMLRFGPAGHEVREAAGRADVDVRCEPGTILELVDARIELLDAIETDRFFLRGSVSDIDWFYDALLFYLDGAVRCPSFPDLLQAFRVRFRQPHPSPQLEVTP